LTGCVDTRSLLILRLMITLICLAVVSSTIGFILDALGAMKYSFKFMRRYAFWYILSGRIKLIELTYCILVFCPSFSMYNRTWP
ncbi:unnamed protein product, partial [Rotaria socialis]